MFEATASSLVTSKPRYSASIPKAVNSSTRFAPALSSIPFKITIYPSVPKRFATSKPIPPVAPVTIATFCVLLMFNYAYF